MRRGLLLLTITLAVLAVSATPSSAGVIVDLIGDKDGFGIGVLPDQGFDWTAVGPPDGDGTDVWHFATQSWTHTYTASGTVQAAFIEIFHGGDQTIPGTGVGQLLIDGTVVGSLTPGFDNSNPFINVARLDVLDLTPFVGLLNGSDTVTVTLQTGDGWVLDYSQLTLQTPEPASLVLIGMSLLLTGALRRDRRD